MPVSISRVLLCASERPPCIALLLCAPRELLLRVPSLCLFPPCVAVPPPPALLRVSLVPVCYTCVRGVWWTPVSHPLYSFAPCTHASLCTRGLGWWLRRTVNRAPAHTRCPLHGSTPLPPPLCTVLCVRTSRLCGAWAVRPVGVFVWRP